ncbi:MAG: cytochrome c-type biogenesis protein CcmH [Terriglobales bacterium]
MVTLSAVTDADTHFNNLGHRLMCTCGCGQVLMECNHVGCQSSERMRAELKTAMGRGGGDDQALNWFVQNYGPVVLAAPGKTGFDRVAWVMPYLVLGLGLTLTGSVVHMWRSRTKAVPGGSSPEARPEVIADLRRRIHEDTEI